MGERADLLPTSSGSDADPPTPQKLEKLFISDGTRERSRVIGIDLTEERNVNCNLAIEENVHRNSVFYGEGMAIALADTCRVDYPSMPLVALKY
jgi:hypothetical protein